MLYRWGVCQVWCPWVSVVEKKCVMNGVSAVCVTFYLFWASNDGTYVWLVGVFHR